MVAPGDANTPCSANRLHSSAKPTQQVSALSYSWWTKPHKPDCCGEEGVHSSCSSAQRAYSSAPLTSPAPQASGGKPATSFIHGAQSGFDL